MPHGVVLLDRKWRVTFVSRTTAAEVGVDEKQGLGRPIWELWPRILGTPLEAALRKTMRERVHQELELASDEGPVVIHALSLFPTRDGLGLMHRDATEEHLLRQRERSQAELAFAASGLGDFSWDMKTGTVTCSARAAAIFGTPRRFDAQEGLLQIDVQDADRIRSAGDKALRHGTPFHLEHRLSRPQDRETWVICWARPEYDKNGEPIGLIGVVADITHLKVQEAKLRESEARFRAFADEAPAPLWVANADGTIEYMNQAGIGFSGLDPAKFRDAVAFTAQVVALIHPDDLERVELARVGGKAEHAPIDLEIRVLDVHRAWRWLRLISHARHDQDGRYLGDIGMFVDVTDVHEAQARQRLLIDELNHRVKNTLATVQSMASQTLRAGLDAGQARETFVDRLFALSAAHNVLTREHWESADLAEIAAQAAAPFSPSPERRIEIKGQSVRLASNVAVGMAIGLHELATNSTKYGALSNANGRVALSWRSVGDGSAVELIWREQGGPAVHAPMRQGFGARFLTRNLGADLAYRPEGLTCTLRIEIIQPRQ